MPGHLGLTYGPSSTVESRATLPEPLVAGTSSTMVVFPMSLVTSQVTYLSEKQAIYVSGAQAPVPSFSETFTTSATGTAMRPRTAAMASLPSYTVVTLPVS